MYKVLVTGGTRGIGAAVAEVLAKAGHEVITCARDDQATYQCDVTKKEDVMRLFEQSGPVDVVINNAGGVRTAPFLKTSEEDWDWHFTLNVKSAFFCTRAFLPAMLDRGWGRIINIASTAGKIGGIYLSAYVASKHALIGLTRALAQEYASRGITANALCPSFVDTPMLRTSVDLISKKTGRSEEDLLAEFRKRNPQQRMIEPGEIGRAAQFLIETPSINGQAISICGGETV